ncbi:putative DNA-binding transcriptional regulator YafY [Orenia metallireducens]|uniref:Predicted DNA-binding transcriptional regulator YafY, contains an HTH and WYL domains n=1 Tax=Orenia metallireducens TaxID=1413210 RepID=A0A285H591_9FIRM|nr:YafY family protein [Orenia metallireducens]PRX28610.1 putative DNA-binding transcriptional regulator YafY [Orenia metallireducens]SNY30764.1 Predicted DNA-binding transcriptional regulator YafY, contains an HTH and WYL domains [Orenia metallireducens]
MKIDRLLAIIILLINKEKMTAKELADNFEVSRRTIYRDVETLNKAGIPVVTTKGVDGGISILDNYKMDKNIFKIEELETIIKALEGVSKVLPDSDLENTLEKLKGFNPDLEEKEETFIIDYSPWGNDEELTEKVNLIKNAIKNNFLIEFSYLSNKNQRTSRKLEPLTIILKGHSWYIYGYCRLRKDFRIFRVSRIRDLTINQEKFIRKKGTPQECLDSNNITDKVKLVLKVDKEYIERSYEYFPRGSFEILEDDSAIIKTEIWENEWLYEFLLGLGEYIEVIEPMRIRDIIKAKLEKTLKKYF